MTMTEHRIDLSTPDADTDRLRDMYEFKQRYGFFYAEDREEDEPCERGTVGCMVDHTKSPDHDSCDCW